MRVSVYDEEGIPRIMADPDWTDPCAILTWLRPQYYRVLAGAHVVQIRHGDTFTAYSETNVSQLGALMRQLEADCRAASGESRRRAFVAG